MPPLTRANIKFKWVICVASIAVSFLNFGLSSSFGAMYVGLLDTFDAGRAKTALVESLLITFCWTFAVVSGVLISRFGVTKATYSAAVMTASGFLGSYFATSIYFLYGFISVAVGMGFSIMYVSAVVCVGRTFTGRQKSVALALQSVGTALAGFMWPHLLTSSIETYGLRGTYLILCGIFLNNVPLAMVLSKLVTLRKAILKTKVGEINERHLDTPHMLDSEHSKEVVYRNDKSKDLRRNSSESTTLHERHSNVMTNKDNNVIEGETKSNDFVNSRKHNQNEQNFRETCCSKERGVYAIYVVAGVLNMSGNAGFLSVYQDINVNNGLTISQSDLTFTSYAFCNLLSRFLPLISAKFPRINIFSVSIVSSICRVISHLIFLTNRNTSFTLSIVAMAFTGLSVGAWISSMQAITFEVLSEQFRGTGYSFMLTAMGVAAAPMGPLFGSVRDETLSYRNAHITAVSMLFVSVLFGSVCLLMSQRSR